MNKQQLENILNNAPEDATHYGHYGDNSVYYLMCGDSGYYSIHKGKWSRLSGIGGTFIWSLSDLQTQLNQLNEIERLKSEKELACQTFVKAIEYALETDEGLKWLELWLDCSTYDELVGWGWEDTPKEAFNGLRVLKELNK